VTPSAAVCGSAYVKEEAKSVSAAAMCENFILIT